LENFLFLENLQQQSDAEPWVVESAVERFERLQATAELNSLQRQKRRNDTLFIGEYPFIKPGNSCKN
jgi:hypothetical protein